MKRIIQFGLALQIMFTVFAAQSQTNLVPNYSFEDNAGFCNGVAGSLWNPAVPGWNAIVVNGSTPDLMRPCMAADWQTPNNISGTQSPSHGNSYAGILGTHSYYSFPNGREYMQIQLTNPLSSGVSYRIQYKASLAENSNGATPLGMALGSSPFVFPSLTAYQAINPLPAFSPAGANFSYPTAITDKTAWTTVSFDYTPSVGNLQYLLIGNIDNATQPTPVPGIGLIGSVGPGAYYYIDEVEVFEIHEQPAFLEETISSSLTCKLFPNPASNRIQLQFPFQRRVELLIFNALGILVGQSLGTNTEQITFGTDFLANGVYLIRLSGDHEYRAILKVCVKH